MNPQFHVHYCIPPDYRFLIAELYYENAHWAELNTENGHLQVVFHARASGKSWILPLAAALEFLTAAGQELMRRSAFFEGTE